MKSLLNLKTILALLAGVAVIATLTFNGCYGTIHVKEEQDASVGNLDEASVQRGNEIYLEHCQSCHGEKLRGDGPEADKYTPKPPDLTKTGFHVTSTGLEAIIDYPHYSAEAFLRRIRHGKDNMPDFKDRFSQEDAEDIINYLQLLSRQESSPPISP